MAEMTPERAYELYMKQKEAKKRWQRSEEGKKWHREYQRMIRQRAKEFEERGSK